jgi:hypothetical protein
MVAMAVMDADIHAGADIADMETNADVGSGSGGTNKGDREGRSNQGFHMRSFIESSARTSCAGNLVRGTPVSGFRSASPSGSR